MKKFFAMLTALALAFSLVSCSSDSGSSEQTDESRSGAKSEVRENLEASQIEQTVIYDENNIKITATGMSGDLFGENLDLLIENNTEQDLLVESAGAANLGGFSVGTSLWCEVAAGKKANDSLSFDSTDLKNCGIEYITDMTFSLDINNSNWQELYQTGDIHLETSNAGKYTPDYEPRGDVVYDGNGIKITAQGRESEGIISDNIVKVYIENNSDKLYTIQTSDMSINGFMVDGIFSCDVLPGTKAVDYISVMGSDIDENNITEITDVELKFHFVDFNNFMDSFDTDSVTITF